MIFRIARMLVFIALVLGSLITFPSSIPWMIFVWLAIHSASTLAGKSPWLPLSMMIAILLIKNVDWPASIPALLGIAGLTAARNLLQLRNRAAKEQPRSGLGQSRGLLIALFACWCWVAYDWYRSENANSPVALKPDRTIVCLGDSLTAAGYPKVLAKMISVEVVDLGQDGITTVDAKKIVFSESFWSHDPQTIVLEIGGHDWNQGLLRRDALGNLTSIIEHCRSKGTSVVLVEIPRGFVTDTFGGIERRLARQYDLQLVSDTPIRKFVFFSSLVPPGIWLDASQHLSEDGLHPNQSGNQVLANYVFGALVKLHGVGVKKQ